MEKSVSREVDEHRSLGSANGVATKYRRALDGGGGGGGGGSGYYRPVGRAPGSEGNSFRPLGRLPGTEGGYYRQAGDGRVRNSAHFQPRGEPRVYGRRFERKPGDGAINGLSRRWKARPPGNRLTRTRDGGEGAESLDEAEGSGGGAGEEEEEEEGGQPHGWTLFKPPATFPVGSSTARILPRISYASKVKENLGAEPTGAGGASDDHSSGPRLGQGLGAIFHNQWGLSFITEPGTGAADGARGEQRSGLNCGQETADPGRLGAPSPEPTSPPPPPPVHRLNTDWQQCTDTDPPELQEVVRYFSTGRLQREREEGGGVYPTPDPVPAPCLREGALPQTQSLSEGGGSPPDPVPAP
ncbi:nuclear fragile X mental retardation-interacting protein 2 [Chiloscyllium plagiosum]|uniref:nuclear fragile X mental retardation-interacting protein 2 n=1 Tax=Chiloscyllium plagiosum TaxID=36176 RepID=UPI001CB86AB1|nr:nuclear fragile X mental retardation-interacting protein 2 [Chiloscyllium plagiosum]